MSAGIIKKEKIKGLIVTADSDFKYKSVAMLNNAAFAGEKFFASSFLELKVLIDRDPLICNLIIDGTGEAGISVLKELPQLQAFIIAHEILFTIIYVTSDSPLLDAAVAKKFPRTLIAALPLAREHFTRFLHDRKARSTSSVSAKEPLRSALSGSVPTDTTQAKPTAEKPLDEAQRMSFEASAHVRVTIDHINVLSKDRSDFAALSNIGQRFNGLFGTFALFADRPGFKEVTALSAVIDDICRTYDVMEADQRPALIPEAHVKLLLAAAKCSFQILMHMRDGKALDVKHQDEFSQIVVEHSTDATISKRDSQDQVDIDALLDAQMNSA